MFMMEIQYEIPKCNTNATKAENMLVGTVIQQI